MGILDPIYALCAISILIQDVRTVFIIRVYEDVLCGAIYNKLQARHGLNSIFFFISMFSSYHSPLIFRADLLLCIGQSNVTGYFILFVLL